MRKWTEEDDERLRLAWGSGTVTAVSRALGFDRSTVRRHADALGLPRPGAQAPAPAPVEAVPVEDGAPPRQDTHALLVELREFLHKNLMLCDANMLPAISREYRATLVDIDGIERAEAGEDGDDAIAVFVGAVRAKLSAS